MKNIFSKIILFAKKTVMPGAFVFLLALPASTNYKLKDYGFGNGGTGNSSSPQYSLEAITGQLNGDQATSPNYKVGAGLIFMGQANVPIAPTFSNPSSYYNRLQIILNTSGNPTDTKYAIAISTDNFSTTNYVQSDNTIGATLGLEDYQTYATWGGAGGFYVIGLTPGTTYYVKVKAMQGKFSETGYGPVATAATVNPTLTFDIDVSDDGTESSPPFSIDMGNLNFGTVVDSPQRIWVDFSTNGETGGNVYVIGKNQGLRSTVANYTISTLNGSLDSAQQGFGAQGSNVSGLTVVSPYDQTGNVVGVTDQYVRQIFSASAPVSGGRASFVLKAKSSAITPAAEDYSETLTVISSGSF